MAWTTATITINLSVSVQPLVTTHTISVIPLSIY